MSGKDKVTLIEKERRVSMVIELIINGADNREVVHYITNKTDWGINERQIYHYIKNARENITKLTDADRQHQIGLALKRMARLIQKALTKTDYSPFVVIAAQKEINELLGLYAPSKHLVAVAELSVQDRKELSTAEDFDVEEGNYEEVKDETK